MSKRDYYDILGVSRTASDDEIKKAYRTLARKWHPDVNKAPEAEKKFAEIQEAYDILTDTKKRQAYDRFGHVGVGAGGARPGGGAGKYTWSDFGSGPGPGGAGGFRVDPGSGGFDVGAIFDELFGGGSGRGRRGGAKGRSQPSSRGRDLHHTITIPFQMAITGGKEQIRLSMGDRTETIDVTIPKGVADGAKLRVRGKGHAGAGGGRKGDLILTIALAAHPYYRRDGLNVLMNVPVTIAEATLGTTIKLPTIKGQVSVKIPPGSNSGQKLRIAGHGIENDRGDRGDFFAVVDVRIPEDLPDEAQQAIESIASQLPNPRHGMPWE